MRIRGALLLATVALVACVDPGADSPAAGTVTGGTATAIATATTAASTTATPSAGTLSSSCRAPATPMVAMTEGPYYTADPPQRSVLYAPGTAGTRLLLSGLVLSRSCAPIASARVDFWQADGNGTYDNSGYTLRGYQLTDTQGRYQLDTVVPGLYPGRTEHIHVKVTPPGGGTTTSQLFFPHVSQNQSDSIFSQAMLVTLTSGTRGPAPGTPIAGRFDFIVNIP